MTRPFFPYGCPAFDAAIGFVLIVAASTSCLAGTLVRFEIDGRQRRPISPYIYGTNQPDWRRGPLFTLARWGGNRTSTYNWETNASNAGALGGIRTTAP